MSSAKHPSWRCRFCYVTTKGTFNCCWTCGKKWFKCEDTTFVPPAERTPRASYQDQSNHGDPFGTYDQAWQEGGEHRSAPSNSTLWSPFPKCQIEGLQRWERQEEQAQGQRCSTGRSPGAEYGQVSAPHQQIGSLLQRRLRHHKQQPQVRRHRQQLAQSKSERDKAEAELQSLPQLHHTLKSKPQGELTEDIKEAIQVADQHIKKVDAKSYRSLVDSLQETRKHLREIEESWNSFRVQSSTYLDQASKLWMTHVDNYEQGKTRFSQRRQEAVQHLHQIRSRIHRAHVRTMSAVGGFETGVMLSAQAALDNAMNVEEQDLVANHENLAQAKEQLVGIVAQVKNTIESRVRKRGRSMPKGRPRDLGRWRRSSWQKSAGFQ